MVMEWTTVDIREAESSHVLITTRDILQKHQQPHKRDKNGGKPEDASKINPEELPAQTIPMDTKRPNTAERAHGVRLPALIMTTVTGGLKKTSSKQNK